LCEPSPRILDERIRSGIAPIDERFVALGGRALCAHTVLRASDPVFQRREIPEGRNVVEKQRRRLAPSLSALIEFGQRLGKMAGANVRDAKIEVRQPQIELPLRGAERLDRIRRPVLFNGDFAVYDARVRAGLSRNLVVQFGGEKRGLSALARCTEHSSDRHED